MNKELDPIFTRNIASQDKSGLLLDIFYKTNPRVKEIVDQYGAKYAPTIKRIYPNPRPNIKLKYNTIMEIVPDGCLFVGPKGYDDFVYLYSYGRWDASVLSFKETNTVGVQDVPLIVETNTKEGVIAAFYNLIDDAIFVEDVEDFEGVKKWKGIVEEDNELCIYTRFENGRRIHQREFTIYAKAYNPDRGFQDSDFVE